MRTDNIPAIRKLHIKTLLRVQYISIRMVEMKITLTIPTVGKDAELWEFLIVADEITKCYSNFRQ
jgi:hypothetical protein